MSEIELIVNGRRYGGWKSITVNQSLERFCGVFHLVANDRWGGRRQPWPILEEDECRVELDGEPIIDGWIERRGVRLGASSRTLTYGGADRASVLAVADPELGKWSWRDSTVLDLARRLAEPHGIPIAAQPGLTLPRLTKLVVNPGENSFDAIARAASAAGVLCVADGAGGLVLTRTGTARAAPLIEGEPLVLEPSFDPDFSDRYHRYVVKTQAASTDQAFGDASRILAEATDDGVRRTDRVKTIRPLDGMTVESARRRADWEARTRAARSEPVSMPVRGWRQPGGRKWAVNELCMVDFPSLGVRGDMLIAGVGFSIDDQGGEIASLRLLRPDAFLPEPKAVVRSPVRRRGAPPRAGDGVWKEIEGGAL